MYHEKPKLVGKELIDHLKSNGIKFILTSEEEAIQYLATNNNYFKLTAYRKSFPKYQFGKNKGKYIDLDFEMLKDLAIIDNRLRYALLYMALDIEHFAKVKLIKIIEEKENEDGYEIVQDFIDSLDDEQKDKLLSEIDNNRKSPYCKDIVEKYNNDYPVWAFVEIIPFGSFIGFYKFCAERFINDEMENDVRLFYKIKPIRNASAHNNCIINDLSTKEKYNKAISVVNNALSQIGISKEIRHSKMSNIRIQQIITLLYSHKYFVKSEGVHNYQCRNLNNEVDRMFKNKEYYKKNDTIMTTFEFIRDVVDKWFHCENFN